MIELEEMCALDEEAMAAARERQAQLVKPPGSLGRLEELAIWLAGVTGAPRPRVSARVVVAAADHGVAAEGVSAFPPEVTGQMLATFLAGGGAVSVLAREVRAELVCVDAGVNADTSHLDVVHTGLAPSANLATTAALTPEARDTALAAGRELARRAAADGITVLVGGEMGIGNTTPATALACRLTQRAPQELTGPGTGLDRAGVRHKAETIERALARSSATAPLDVLADLGGGEIAVLTGLALGAGEHGLGYVCDGVIATAAAAVAVAHRPELKDRLLAGHRSPEPAHAALLAHLGLEPVLDLGMRLGEASGAVTALAVLKLAAAAHDGMQTFAEAGVSS
jgi:nicotinate-nucleotide--dimethylbenzimidazole phosphoribosyltransferase